MAAVEKWAALAPSQLPYTTVADLDPAQIKSRQQGRELQELQPQLQVNTEPSPSPQQSIFPGACGDIVYRYFSVMHGFEILDWLHAHCTRVSGALLEEGEPPEDMAALLIGGAE